MRIKSKKPEIRFLNDMGKVIYDKRWLKKTANFEVYYMYRGIKKKGELRYDITVIPAQMLGQEFTKTKGHIHYQNFQELYKVLKGKAIFLLQKAGNKKVEDILALKAKAGDVVIVPPYYGHITINPSKNTLAVANWVSKKCKNIYTAVQKNRGFCYLYTKRGWIKNKNYKIIPKLRFEKPLKEMPKSLNFLEKTLKNTAKAGRNSEE